jgi:flagellar motor protein MotB
MKKTILSAAVVILTAANCRPAQAEEQEPILLAQAYSGLSMGLARGAAGGALLGRPAAEAPAVGSAGRVAPQAPADQGVDLSNQFNGPSRNQGDVGSCHAFASVAVLEAAYYRRYGEKLQLSEADLFLRRNVLSRTAYENFLSNGSGELSEGNNTPDDIQFAIDHGVATRPQYEAFVGRYIRHRDAERRTLEDLERQNRNNPWYVRMLYNPREHWVRMQQDPTAQRILQGFLTGNDSTIQAQREEVRRKLSSFKLTTTNFDSSKASFNMGRDECRRKGAAAVEKITAELKANRPVAISYYTDADGGGHALMVTGYRTAENGSLVLRTRNSWGPGSDHDISADRACTIYRMMSVDEGKK